MHAAAIGAWLAGDWHGASAILDDLLFSWPRDVLALQVGHQLDFFLGDSRNLRDRPARSLDAFESGRPPRRVGSRDVRIRAGGVRAVREGGRGRDVGDRSASR